MARVAKIDNALMKRYERTEKSRPTNTRNKRVYFLIVCEGEKTEPKYFKAIENELPQGTIELEIAGTGRNTIGLVNYTIEQRNKANRKYDQVWAVFDKDDFPDANFNSAIFKAEANGIKCAWTNEAFELWFMLHFQYVDTGMSRDEYKKFIERELTSKIGNVYKYKKNAPDTYVLLKKYGNLTQAIVRAKKLKAQYTDQCYANHNPCTCVYELIEALFNPKEILKEIAEKDEKTNFPFA